MVAGFTPTSNYDRVHSQDIPAKLEWTGTGRVLGIFGRGMIHSFVVGEVASCTNTYTVPLSVIVSGYF